MEEIFVTPWFPRGVEYIITSGSSHYIGFVDNTTILKYPHDKGNMDALRIEQRILRQLGKHPRIIEYKGDHEDGVLLEYAPLRSLDSWMRQNETSRSEKLQLARELAEGVAYVHSKNVIICDIGARNILLDAEKHVKLCDFQGRLLGADGKVILDGGASENAESFMPRHEKETATFQTDIFALGSTIYHIMTGHRPFPELDTIDDEAEFTYRYQAGLFPPLEPELGGDIVWNCWRGVYTYADEVNNCLVKLSTEAFPHERGQTCNAR